MAVSRINQVRRFTAYRSGLKTIVDATLALPAAPLLAVFCCTGRPRVKDRERLGERVPHGNRLLFDCDPMILSPVSGEGTQWHWEFPTCHCRGKPGCQLVVFEYSSTPGFLRWTSLPHDCPECPPLLGYATINYYNGIAAGHIEGLAGMFLVNPALFPDRRTIFLFHGPGADPYFAFWTQFNLTGFQGTGTITIQLWGGGQIEGIATPAILKQATFPVFTGQSIDLLLSYFGNWRTGNTGSVTTWWQISGDGGYGGPFSWRADMAAMSAVDT